MKTIQLLILVTLGFLFLAATCRPLTTDDLNKLEPRMKMFKGPCFGSCPVYTLTIYENGIASYEGQRFTDRMGLHTKLLDRTTYQALLKAFDEADMWSFQNAYKAQIPDLATVTITYYKDGESKAVKGKDGRPAKIVELDKMLTQIAESSGWEQQTDNGNYGLSEDMIADELLVNLSNQVDPNVWVIQYAKQDLQIVKRISPNSPYWVFRFNPDRMSPNDMLATIRRDAYVLSAEFNRRQAAQGRR
ncbi:MAG: DUF6438 domain-containing protein [Bacteroidota bacterium]